MRVTAYHTRVGDGAGEVVLSYEDRDHRTLEELLDATVERARAWNHDQTEANTIRFVEVEGVIRDIS